MHYLKYLSIFIFLFLCSIVVCCIGKVENNTFDKQISGKKEYQYSDYERLNSLHIQLGKPKPDEWLYTYKESRQSFAEYISTEPVCPTQTRNKIYILPLGRFNKIEQKLIENTVEYVHKFFMLKVELLNSIPDKVIPKKSRRLNEGVEQLQTFYILDSILRPNIPADAICYISITNKDLYPSEGWNYVFGQASLTQRTGVSSFCRFYENKLDSSNYIKCLERTVSTTTHELCHMFSLKHCIIYQCLVNGSNHLEEADSKPLWLCSECLAKLQWCIKFDLIERYDSLIDFSNKYGFENEKQYYLKSIQLMNN